MTSVNRREREKIARRNDILKAATVVFSSKGYDEATLDEIAEVAEYGKGTIYNYFKGKEDLFISLLLYGIDQIEKVIKKAMNRGKNCRERLRNIAIDSLKYSTGEGSDFFRILVNERGRLALSKKGNIKENLLESHLSMIKIIAGVMENGIEDREIRKLDAEKAADFFIHMVQAIFVKNFCLGHKVVFKDEVDFLVSLFFDGIAVKK